MNNIDHIVSPTAVAPTVVDHTPIDTIDTIDEQAHQLETFYEQMNIDIITQSVEIIRCRIDTPIHIFIFQINVSSYTYQQILLFDHNHNTLYQPYGQNYEQIYIDENDFMLPTNSIIFHTIHGGGINVQINTPTNTNTPKKYISKFIFTKFIQPKFKYLIMHEICKYYEQNVFANVIVLK